MKKITITLLLLVLLSLIAFSWISLSKNGKRVLAHYGPKIHATYVLPSAEYIKIQSKAFEARAFVKQNHFDTSICFLVDMALPANHKRFFVYDLSKDTIVNAGLVAHGNCNQYWLEGRKYGNQIGCGCTSLGKYRIGNAYYGKFGLAFKLYGLDQTNSNAFNRFVVLHAHECIPDHEVVEEVCQSNGCPMVSPRFLNNLNAIVRNSKRPILLWISE